MKVYHGTTMSGLTKIKANSKSHSTGKLVAFFTESRAYALLCCRIPEENHVTCGVREDGKLHYFEEFHEQLKVMYEGKSGKLYIKNDVEGLTNTQGFTYESSVDVEYDTIEDIYDVYVEILKEVEAGNLVLHTYESMDEEHHKMYTEYIWEHCIKGNEESVKKDFYKKHFGIHLVHMTDEMYYEYFKEYDNDPDLYLDKNNYKHYEYSEKQVAEYIERKKEKKNISMAIKLGDVMIGELIFKKLKENESVSIGITLKNQSFKDKGYGLEAERQAMNYAFNELHVKIVYADSIITNTRSQHVLEKVGFEEIHRDNTFVYYKCENKEV